MASANQRVVLEFARASRAMNVERKIQSLEAEWKRLRIREQEIIGELKSLHATRDSGSLALSSTFRRA